MSDTWQNNHHCAVCYLKSQFHPSCSPTDCGRFPFPFWTATSFITLFLFACHILDSVEDDFIHCQSLTSVSLWFETDKNPTYKLKMRSSPLMLGKQCLRDRTYPRAEPVSRPASQGDGKNVALPAGTREHSFLFGTEVPDAHIIKLLNEDFVAHLSSLWKGPFSLRRGWGQRKRCCHTGEQGSQTLLGDAQRPAASRRPCIGRREMQTQKEDPSLRGNAGFRLQP